MRRRFVMRGGRLVELDLEASLGPAVAPQVMSDLDPYQSMRTGETIRGRAEHREHLRRYGLEEVGNELGTVMAPRKAAYPEPGEIAADIKRQLARDPAERRAEAERALRQSGTAGPVVERILK